jgi:glycosyltransferase involved in cell wall biosynthesis
MEVNNNKQDEVLVVSTYPPIECGIATYSKDLVDVLITQFDEAFAVRICAIEKKASDLNGYHPLVKFILNSESRRSYIRLSEQVNADEQIKLVVIQHEFGLFGGAYGKYLMLFLRALKKPFMITFHTVLPNPDIRREKLVQKIAGLAAKVLVMTHHSERILVTDYAVKKDKIKHIPHGTHVYPAVDVSELKRKYALEGKRIITTFGLISSNKNIELVLDALPDVVNEHPNTIYLIIGKTHPEILKNEGEIYRNALMKRVVDNNLEAHVLFINRFVELNELLEFLHMTDIYVFASKDRNQTVSGTFAYAFSCGCSVIATSIPHAKEMINEQTGILIDFDNPNQLTEAINQLLRDDDLRSQLKINALQLSKSGDWKNSAIKHAQLFQPYLKNGELQYALPPLTLKHLITMSYHHGIVQFSKLDRPDILSGFTLDDNARALIAVCMDFEIHRNEQNYLLMDKYLRFVGLCQQENGQFVNYLDESGKHHAQNDSENLEDSNGRALWALGTILSYGNIIPKNLALKADILFSFALPNLTDIQSPRALAFTIKGLYLYNLAHHDAHLKSQLITLADKLVHAYFQSKTPDWKWFEDYLTYSNSILPEALLYAYLSSKNEQYKSIAKITFDFLLDHIFVNGQIKVISNRGWLKKGERSFARGGEQPIDVSYTIQTLLLFYEVFKDETYHEKVYTAFSWFLGNNHLGEMIYNPTTGGCFDGLERHNVNLNQGAESTICYIMARLSIERLRLGKTHTSVVNATKKQALNLILHEQYVQ